MNNIIPARRILVLIVLRYFFELKFSVRDNTIGVIPIGLINVNKVEKDLDSIWKGIMLAYRQGVLPMLNESAEDLSNLRNSQYEQEDPYEYYALEFVESTTRNKFTARDVLVYDMFRSDPEKIKRLDLTAMGKALRRIGCQSAGQSNKKGDRSRLWTKPVNNSDQLSKPDPVSSSKSQSEQSLMAF